MHAWLHAEAKLFQYDGPLDEVDPEIASIIKHEKNRQVWRLLSTAIEFRRHLTSRKCTGGSSAEDHGRHACHALLNHFIGVVVATPDSSSL